MVTTCNSSQTNRLLQRPVDKDPKEYVEAHKASAPD